MTDQGANRLRALLESEPVINDLRARSPKLDGNTLEERAMAASERNGYDQCLLELQNLATQVSQQPMTSPHLDMTKFEQVPQQPNW